MPKLKTLGRDRQFGDEPGNISDEDYAGKDSTATRNGSSVNVSNIDIKGTSPFANKWLWVAAAGLALYFITKKKK